MILTTPHLIFARFRLYRVFYNILLSIFIFQVRTFGDAFRIVFGALSIILSITTFIVMSDFTFLLPYLQAAHRHLNFCPDLFTSSSEAANQV